MTLSFWGSVLIITGCVAIGFLYTSEYQKTVNCLHQLQNSLEQMEYELNYSACSLPELFRIITAGNAGSLKQLWANIADELDSQIVPNAETCMRKAIHLNQALPVPILDILNKFAECLGKYDLHGQLQGLTYTQELCSAKLKELEENMEERLRCYRVFGLCGGIALVIILI